MRKKWLGIALVVFAFAAILFYVLNRQPAEPVYEGKPIGLLIEEGFYQPGDTYDRKADLKATEAVLKIGTNAMPYYIACLNARDSRFKVRLLTTLAGWNEKHHLKGFNFTDRIASVKRGRIFAALQILRTNALTAAPALVRLLRDGEAWEKIQAVDLLVNMGPQSVSAVTNALTDGDYDSQRGIILALGGYGYGAAYQNWGEYRPKSPKELAANARVVVPFLIGYANDTNKLFRDCALISLASFCKDPFAESNAIPVFSKFERSPNLSLRKGATQALLYDIADGSTNALTALTGLLQETNAQFRCQALDTLSVCGRYAQSVAPEIKKSLNDPDVHVRAAATNALSGIYRPKFRAGL